MVVRLIAGLVLTVTIILALMGLMMGVLFSPGSKIFG